jgi:hypothetical protein
VARAGFAYDSSIVPSVRPDRYAYNNLAYGLEPFRIESPGGRLVELPVACLRHLRLPLVFSYVKLLGMPAYRGAMALFPPPGVLVTYMHPYDLYAAEIAPNFHDWKRYAHGRNGRRGMELLRELIGCLKGRGYSFALMSDVAETFAERELHTHVLKPAS